MTGVHPMQKFKLRHNPTAGAIRTFVERSSRFQPMPGFAPALHQPPVREPRAFDAMMTILKLPSYHCIFLAVPGAKQPASWVNEWSTCV
jgi:hypothetical protein